MRSEQKDIYVGDDWWDWSVWIEGTPAELSRVKSVTYILDSSFSSPVRVVRSRKTNFRLENSGWGEFTIEIEVNFQDGKSRKMSHDLKLHYPSTRRKSPTRFQIVDVTPKKASLHTANLLGAITMAAPKVDVKAVKSAAQPALKIALTGPTVSAVAKGITTWLSHNSGVRLQIVSGSKKNVQDVSLSNAASLLRAARDDQA